MIPENQGSNYLRAQDPYAIPETVDRFEMDKAKAESFGIRISISNRDFSTLIYLWEACSYLWTEYTFIGLMNEMYMFEWGEGIQKFLENEYTQVLYKMMSPHNLQQFISTFLLPKFNSNDDEDIVKTIALGLCQPPYAMELSYVLLKAASRNQTCFEKI
jgi:hypothetical protein